MLTVATIREDLLQGHLQLDVQGQRGFRRHRGRLRVNDVWMQGASGLGIGHAEAESLARDSRSSWRQGDP